MQIQWSAAAIDDGDRIFSFIAEDNPPAAVSIDEQLQAAVEGLTAFPLMGREGRVPGTRELVVSGTPYIAVYSLRSDRVLILRILHGAMMWP